MTKADQNCYISATIQKNPLFLSSLNRHQIFFKIPFPRHAAAIKGLCPANQKRIKVRMFPDAFFKKKEMTMIKKQPKADLRVHLKMSYRPSHWILQKLSCPESFTTPARVYEVAKQRGMDLVTITDHNTINGSLEIAHLPDTFVSEEITTYFPEDNCKIHVLAHPLFDINHRLTLAHFEKMLLRMKQAARKYMENRSFEENFLKTWNLFNNEDDQRRFRPVNCFQTVS